MNRRIHDWWSGLPVRSKVTSILLAVLVPIILAIVLHVHQINNLLDLQQQRHRVVLAQEQTRILELLAIDIEDGFRGYLITSDPAFLTPLREAEARIDPVVKEAVVLLDGFPALSLAVEEASDRLRDLMISKHQLIERFQSGGAEEVIGYVKSGKGLALSDAIREQFRSIEYQLDRTAASLDAGASGVAQHAFWGLVFALIGSILLGTLGSRLLTLSITRPLSLLGQDVKELQLQRAPDRGPLDKAAAIATADEIGELARSFESMAREIKDYISELEALNEIGHEINTIGPDGLDGVLRRITNRAAEVLRVDLCVVVVKNEQMGCWVIESASGNWWEQLQKSVMLWEELPGAVRAFEAKQAVAGEGSPSGPMLGLTRRHAFDGESMLSIPLLGQDTPFGVLALVRRKAVPGVAWNLRLASGFANEAAVAISNARLYDNAKTRGKTLERRILELEHLAESLAHDLRGPGERMMGLGGLLLKNYGDLLDERGRRWLDLLEQNGQEMVERAERILEVARIGAQHDRLEVVDPALVVDDVLKVKAGELEARGIRVDVGAEFPLVACHRAYLHQVLENLVSNAIKYTAGHPAAVLRIAARKEQGCVSFSVSDNGVGIPPEQHERVFEPFVRLNPSASKGSGIGLAIVQRIVRLYGGRVWVESEVDQGCTVFFTFPALACSGQDGESDQRPVERIHE